MSEKQLLAEITQAAAVVLDYLLRYEEQSHKPLPKGDIARALGGSFPLFRYLFPTSRFLIAPIEELERLGLFDGDMHPDAGQRNWIRYSAKEYIRLQDEDIFQRIDFSKIWEIVEGVKEDENVEWFIGRLKFRNIGDLRQAVSLSKLHNEALLEIGAGHSSIREALIAATAERVGLKKMSGPTRQDAFEVQFGLFEASDLIPNSHFSAAIALLNGNSDKDLQLAAAERFVEAHLVHNVLFMMLGHNDELERSLNEFVVHRRAVLLRDIELKRLGVSPNPKETLREFIFRQLPPSMVSPFRSRGPVTGDGFFGRRTELFKIARTPNTVLLGSRRIGKTSLLQALRDEVNAPSERNDNIAVFVEAGKDRHLSWFQKDLMEATLEESERAGVQLSWIGDGESFFHELATALRKSRRKFLFLIDEVDNLLKDPRIGLFEEFVRSMANSNYARFVLSGYIVLRKQTENRGSFLYNLFTPFVLGPLTRRDAGDLVRTQMRRIHVEFENDQVVERILDLGTTFAAYVQLMCELLLKRLDEPIRRRCITLNDVESVYQSREFSEEIVKAVTVNVEEELGPLERLILYWAAARGRDKFTVEDLLKEMEWLKLKDLLVSLSYLTETYLLSESEGRYTFYTYNLGLKLREAGGLDVALSQLTKEYRGR